MGNATKARRQGGGKLGAAERLVKLKRYDNVDEYEVSYPSGVKGFISVFAM